MQCPGRLDSLSHLLPDTGSSNARQEYQNIRHGGKLIWRRQVRVQVQERLDLINKRSGLEDTGAWKRTEPKVATRRISFSYSTLAPGGRWTYEIDQL